MQLTKAEIMQTNMIVTTPEKWDVITRKGTGDVALTQVANMRGYRTILTGLADCEAAHSGRGAPAARRPRPGD